MQILVLIGILWAVNSNHTVTPHNAVNKDIEVKIIKRNVVDIPDSDLEELDEHSNDKNLKGRSYIFKDLTLPTYELENKQYQM